MKNIFFFLCLCIFLVSCSKDEPSNNSIKSYSAPELFLGQTKEGVTTSLGEPDFNFTYEYTTEYSYMSDKQGWHSVVYRFSGDNVHSTEVNFKGSKENLDFIKNHLQSSYGNPEDLLEHGGIKGLRYPVSYPLTDLHYSSDAEVIYIEYVDMENPEVQQ